MGPSRIALLQAMPIFGALREDAIECVLQDAPSVDIPKGGYFFREGDQADCMYVIETGVVEVLKFWDGSDWSLHLLGAGDCFGEMALMDFGQRSASVRAAQDTRAIAIATAALHRLYERDIEQFSLIQMNLGREVCRRLRATDELLFRMRMSAEVACDPGPTLT
jgi:CRP/FNR family transcriptional regulator, cyclic AMP receptor protein